MARVGDIGERSLHNAAEFRMMFQAQYYSLLAWRYCLWEHLTPA